MIMRDIDELLPRVLEKAAACPEPTAIRHLRDAAREFCRRTRIWRWNDSFAVSAEGEDPIGTDPNAEIFEITAARFADTSSGETYDLEAKTIDWLDKEEPGWRDLTGTPAYLTQLSPGTVDVVPKPELGGTLTLQLILIPAQAADQLPDFLIDTYPMTLADGALGTLLLLPAEFGNAQLGTLHGSKFQEALAHFGDLIPRGQHRAKRRTTPSSYF